MMGQAVTCEDFFAAMRDANDADFSNFLLWYSQAGTPVLKVKSSYNSEGNTYTLKIRQEIPSTPGQSVKESMFIPVVVGLLDSNGKDLPLTSVYNGESLQSLTSEGHFVSTVILGIEKEEEEFVFVDIPERPIPSLLHNYSAPVRLVSDITDDDLYFLLTHDIYVRLKNEAYENF
jgi:aminopeptidase N